MNDFLEKLNNCNEKFIMEMAVKCSWVLNIADTEDNRILSRKNITKLPKLQLTEEGLHNILTEDLWVMGGNHRRLALIEYNTQLNEHIKILEVGLLVQNIAMGISTNDTNDTNETSTANAAAAGSGPPMVACLWACLQERPQECPKMSPLQLWGPICSNRFVTFRQRSNSRSLPCGPWPFMTEVHPS